MFFVFSVVNVLAAFLLLCAQAVAQPAIPAGDRALVREIFEELVEIPTTAAEGTGRAAQMLAGRLLAAGFPKQDVQVLGPDAKTRNLLVRFRGRNPNARGVLLMAHIDVVAARREDWSVDPWTLLERDGWFYGRGTLDNKAGAAMLVANFIRLKRQAWQPERDLIALLTGDEESNQNGIKWMLAEHRGLVDAELAFNTDVGGVQTRNGAPVFFDVQASEKIYADYQLEVTDAGGHSSLVRPDNPIYTLSAALNRIGEHQFPLHVSDATRIFLERASSTETGQTAIDMRAVAAIPPDQAAAARLSRSPFYNAQLRTTCVATRVDAGHANNALPQLARAVVNCRILPGMPGADVERVLRQLAGDKVKLTVLEAPVTSPPSPVTPALLTALDRMVARHWPNLPVIPTMIAGATDGMYTRSAGIPTYGVSALEENPDDVRAHGRDERVGVEPFYKAAQFWMDLMRTFGDAAN
ncbi:MAG: M20/M25/M40 family metallo-hydrolase [Acidobacteria bacterium]|nr:MAG: M20/M25/M40 family metallo-hydrolase [Acidobacteriota bacterium]